MNIFETIDWFSIELNWMSILDLYLWNDCQYTEYHCVDTKGHEQNANQHNTEVAVRCWYVCDDRVHTIYHLYDIYSAKYVD